MKTPRIYIYTHMVQNTTTILILKYNYETSELPRLKDVASYRLGR